MPACASLLTLLWISVVCAPLLAQKGTTSSPETAAAVATAIRDWVRDYERGNLGPKGILRVGSQLQPAYVAAAKRAGRIGPDDVDRLTHLDVLQKLLFVAETEPSPDMADAVLGLCAAGLEGSFLDFESLQLRELGHWALMRMDHQGAWFLVLRAAAGERVPVLSDVRGEPEAPGENGLTVGPARRVAALRLLGGKGLPVFRSTLEAALTDTDPRVRLAAAESMGQHHRPDSLRKVTAALETERHPVVSQALVRQLLSLLRSSPDLEPAVRQDALARAFEQFGRSGWRTDMDLLDLVQAFPNKDAIPMLISALDLEQKTTHALVDAVNKRASPLLRDRAVTLLRAMTGALIANNDAAAWRAFWMREQDHIVVPDTLAMNRKETTRATFFGVPVTGGAIAFLIDTSYSMNEVVAGTSASGKRIRGAPNRLRAAKEQIVTAVQALPAESTFVVLTFAEKAHVWTSVPQKPTSSSLRSLTELLSRFQPNGGTNLYDGLASALQLGDQRYGEQTATKIDELFLLSDGEPTAGDLQDPETMLKVVREANKYGKVRINTVFTGTGKGGALLQRLAEENGGVFVQR